MRVTEPIWTTLSGVLLVDDLLVAEMDGHTELHVDCLMQGLGGDLLPVSLYYSFTDAGEIARWKALLQPGTLLLASNEALDVIGGSLQMLGAELRPFEGDEATLRREFESRRVLPFPALKGSPAETSDRIVGQVMECRVLPTRKAGPMAIVKVDTTGKTIEVLLSPDVFRRHRKLVTELGYMEFCCAMQEREKDSPDAALFVAKDVYRG